MWKVVKGRLVHMTDVSRTPFRTSFSKAILDELKSMAKEHNTYVNYLLESGVQQMLDEENLVLPKYQKPSDRIQYNTTYDTELLKELRDFAKEKKLHLNDVLEMSVAYIDYKIEKSVHHRYRTER